MYLSNIKLWNFRKFGSNITFDILKPNLNLNFNKGLNVLIGENDSGKSAILDAIKLVLKTNTGDWIKVNVEEDFYKGTSKIRLELRFDGFEANEARNFTEFLSIEGEGADTKEFLIVFCEIFKYNEKVLPYDIKAGPNGDLGILGAEQKELLNVTYLKPLRDVKNEFIPKKGSRLSTILENHEAFKGKGNTHLLMSHFEDFNKSIENYFKGLEKNGTTILVDKKGQELKKKIDDFISKFLSISDEGVFGVNPGELKNILEKLELTLKNNTNPGLGTLNRLFIASELVHLQRNNYDGLELGLIEEIEAHIHPQAQMKVIEALQNKLNEKPTQLIITTHSPNLASKLNLENLIICSNNFAFPMGGSYTELDNNDYKFLERFLDVTKSNLFFSEGVVLVEGWAEEILLPTLARLLKKLGVITKDLTEAQVSIVNVGNDTFFRYAKIFQRKIEPFMSKKVAIVTDLDLRPEKYKDLKIVSNELVGKSDPDEIKVILKEYKVITGFDLAEIDLEKVKKKESENVTQGIQTFLSSEWTLEYCLGLFPKFQKLFFKAILYSFKEIQGYVLPAKMESLRKFMEDDFEDNFSALGSTDSDIAFNLYIQMLGQEKIADLAKVEVSKTIVAQYFAKFIEEESLKIILNTDGTINTNGSIFEKSDFENETSISYLVDALKHVT